MSDVVRTGTCPMCNQLYDLQGECVCDEIDKFFEDVKDIEQLEDTEAEDK